MAKAVTCPVCNGTGKVTKQTVGMAGGTFEVTCHGCGGKGWVEVADDPMPYVPYCPPYEPEPYYPWYLDYYPWYPNTTYPHISPPYVVTCEERRVSQSGGLA